MNMKQLLIPVVLTAIFSLNANASLVELEFSNGATVSFDDTINHQFIGNGGTDWEYLGRYYNSVRTIVSRPDNVITAVSSWSTQTRESLSRYNLDYFSAYSRTHGSGFAYKANHIFAQQGTIPITSDIVSSLVDVVGQDNLFGFRGSARREDGVDVFHADEYVTLTNVFVDGVSQTSPVPVPAAVWLFGTAIMGLIARRKLWNKNGAL